MQGITQRSEENTCQVCEGVTLLLSLSPFTSPAADLVFMHACVLDMERQLSAHDLMLPFSDHLTLTVRAAPVFVQWHEKHFSLWFPQ